MLPLALCSPEFPFVTYDTNHCAGDPRTASFSNLVSGSFIYLFTSFYLRTYKAKDGKGAKAGKAGKEEKKSK